MSFAPAVVGFTAFGRGRTSDLVLLFALGVIGAVGLMPPFFPPVAARAQRLLVWVCAADALLLLRLGVVALTDTHAAASAAAATAGDDLVAAAAARASALEAMGAKVAHEVRNPLSAIRGLVEVLAEKSHDERDRQRLAVVVAEVSRIDEILRGYLALARPLERIEPMPCDVASLVCEAAAVIEARAERAGVTVLIEAGAATAEIDPRRIKEALLNLLLNSIEATPPGGRIRLGADTDDHSVQITVEDSGVGMDERRLATTGSPFATGRPGGTGLGLALARQAIEQHGGTLTLSSEPGRGTLARLLLPRRGRRNA
jgi:signal transduction histidine kinase